MANGILTLNPNFPERNLEGEKLPLIEAPVGAGIGLALANFLKDKKRGIGDNNPPSPIDEEKPPQQEPPEGEPDLLPELTKQTAEEVIRKKIKEKEPLNKIQTWDKYFDSKEEAEKAVKDAGGTLKEFEEGAIQKQITFRKHNYGYDVLFDKKRVGELLDITENLKEFGTQQGNKKTFNLVFVDEDGMNQRDAISTIDGLSFAKERTKELVAKDLLRNTTEPLYPSLKDIFQNLKYNKKGEPITIEYDEKNKKAMGGFIDKHLTGNSRYIEWTSQKQI